MKSLIIWLLLIVSANQVIAQKSVIGESTYAMWPTLKSPKISANGQYVGYIIDNQPVGGSTLVLKQGKSVWRRDFKGVSNVEFSSDSKYAIFIQGKDSLAIFSLGTDNIEYIPKVSNFEVSKNGFMNWVYYSLSDKQKTLIVKDLETCKLKMFKGVVESWCSDNGKTILLKIVSEFKGKEVLNWLDYATGKVTEIWQGDDIANILIDDLHNQVVFTVADSAICFYKPGNAKAHSVLLKSIPSLPDRKSSLTLSNFSNDGNILFFNIKELEEPKSTKGIVEVWSYHDVKLQSEQESENTSLTLFFALDFHKDKIVHLGNIRPIFPEAKNASDTLALLRRTERLGEPWSIGKINTTSLVNTRTGKITAVDILENRNTSISSSGKYLIYFDAEDKNYFSFEIATKILRNISRQISVSWLEINYDRGNDSPRGVACWLKNDESVLIYDQFDIWEIDPKNERKPVNITNKYGFNHGITFRLALSEYGSGEIRRTGEIILNAFNLKNKNNGFFKKKFGEAGDPVRLHFGPYLYQLISNPYVSIDYWHYPIKAKNANRYLLKRTCAAESPNYFLTRDFKSFEDITDFHPEADFNWLSAELHEWKSLDGRKLQGILYKPQDFDPKKRYPVIFHIYERLSDRLNTSFIPQASYGALDIPTFVSNGYLVLCPDIYYKVGAPMTGTYDAVVSAAQYISALPFVDPKKFGLQGHSFGGMQTNYLVAHTDIFAAACSASGNANWVSAYGGLIGGLGNPQWASLEDYYEKGQGRMGGSLWDMPNAYIGSSPIFKLNKIATPLLIMQGRKDHISLYSNIMELFTGLRRMGKKAWMLVYPDEGHQLHGKEANDFSVRMMQFFDYYLKDRPAPIWMLYGIPASKRENDNGLELDTTGQIPGPGLPVKNEVKKIDRNNDKPNKQIFR
ncbi:dienelactone hydrolase [Pedobacter africanus]|uniref:Dienelactone hydrolase n=1 Tax=Pedobacter africanus TaxID=151894 RepID=A0ACC6L4N9_9SPHI|nr:prolyl oligopeptidase family serine peptidase [Pedobacter africanus]MDR6786456.1 dienelactone hydrolase [Pedobacter africanus]